jgi:hypothetical protein
MRARNQRRRTGRIYVWSAAGLLLLFGTLTAFDYYARHHPPARSAEDPALKEQLQQAPLAEVLPTAPGEWPQWRGPRRDGVSAETGWLKDWPPQGPKVLWQVEGGDGYSALAVAGGRVYTLVREKPEREQEAVLCLDAESGAEKWRYAYPCSYRHRWGNGPRSTPAVDGPYVYTVGATGIFHCLEAATGRVVWSHDLLKEFEAPNLQWGTAFSPLVEGDLVFTMSGGPDGNSLAAFDKRSGGLKWKALDDPAGYSSPIAVTAAGVRQVVFFTGKNLVGVSPQDGKLYWSYPWETKDGVNAATPISWGDYLFISSGYGKGCALLKVEKDGADGLQVKRVYENNLMRNHFSGCVLYKEHLYGFTDPGILTCMEFRTGVCDPSARRGWQQRGFGKGSLMAADGHLIILGEEGRLALAEATPEGYREKASCRIFHDRSWTVPVLADGRLYLRDQQQIVCLDLRAGPR